MQLCDALGASTVVHPLYRRLVAMTLTELNLLESHMQQRDGELAALLRVHRAAVRRLAAVPGFVVDSAQQIIAEVGPTATTCPTAKHLASWVGACPWHEESAGINRSHRAPHGNRQMRRLLNTAAHAAVKIKGSIFELLYKRFVGRVGHCPGDWRDCASVLSAVVEDPARRRHVPGTRSGRQPSAVTASSRQNASRTPVASATALNLTPAPPGNAL